MCSTDTANLIEDVVQQKVDNDEMFTAFDISLDVKEKAKAEGLPVERHRHMRRQIHNAVAPFVNNCLYESTTWNVGAATPAILYYPSGGDPNQYVPRSRNDKNLTPGKVVRDGLFDDNDADDADSGVDLKGKVGDARGTLGVPNKYIRNAGFQHGQKIYVRSGNLNGEQALILSTDDTSALTSYTVDHNDNIRVTRHILNKGGIACGSGYKFDCWGNEVFILSTQ